MDIAASETGAAELVIAYLGAKSCAACYAEMHAEERAEEKRDEIKEISEAENAEFHLNSETPEGTKNLFLSDLSPEDEETVKELQARDKEVRDHEQAHARVGGQYAGEPTYSYQAGPDGKQYAIGGEVAIDVAPIDGDPAATIDKMDVVKAAALAPAEPSAQDRRVAALADAQRMQALGDLAEMRQLEAAGVDPSEGTGLDVRA